MTFSGQQCIGLIIKFSYITGLKQFNINAYEKNASQDNMQSCHLYKINPYILILLVFKDLN